MEALVALGLASNVVQFVDFSLKIYSKTLEIAHSAQGRTELNAELERSCLRLEDFISKLSPIRPEISLQNAAPAIAPDDLIRRHEDTIREHVDGIKRTATECNIVCHQLLQILGGLCRNPSGHFLFPRSLVAGLKEYFKSKQITQLETKLKDFQGPLLLHLSSLLNERAIYMTHLLESVKARHMHAESQQTTRFYDLSSHLSVMSGEIKALSQRLDSYNSEHMLPKPSDVEGLESMLSGLRLSEEDIGKAAQEQEVLKSLDFSEKVLRHETIAEAHKRTFEWVFQSRAQSSVPSEHGATQTGPPRSGDFIHWLQSGKGVFWVTGKPGSGKSTLMKFIASHRKTRIALDSWAGGKKAILASHYFWALGTDKQKSLGGLLQKMIFDVLCRCPQLAWDMFPMRCQQADTASAARSFSLPLGDAWSLGELHEALLLLAKHPAAPAKFCFFIDGLDEYSGDHIDLCQMLKGFVESKNLKCCVSSRPWNVFSDAFGSNEAALLRVHDLTQDDINMFARERLADIPGRKHPSVNKASIGELADLITKRAEGVFLWVYLVTKETRNAIANSSTMKELQQLLQGVPNELEKYFGYTLDRVPERYHQYMAKTFQVALAAKTPHTVDVYHHISFKDNNSDYAVTMPINDGSGFTFPDHGAYESCKRQINDRCAGLFSFHSGVEFIHRTVYSYLMTGPMQDYLKSKIETVFHPNLATLESLVFIFRCNAVTKAPKYLPLLHPGHIQQRRKKERPYAITRDCWFACFAYVGEAMREDQETTSRLLDGIVDLQFEVIPYWTAKLKFFLGDGTAYLKRVDTQTGITSKDSDKPITKRRPQSTKLPLKAQLLRSETLLYTLAKLHDDPNYFAADNISALGTLLLRRSHFSDASEWENAILQLLENKQNPNENIECTLHWRTKLTTPWMIVMFWLYSEHRTREYSEVLLIVSEFLKHGADKASQNHGWYPLHRYLNYISGVLPPTFPNLELVRDTIAAFLDTSLQSRKRNLEALSISLLISSSVKKWMRSALDKSTMAEIVDMIITEMMNVSLGNEAILEWQDLCSLEFGSPHVQEKVKDYLSALSSKRPQQLFESEPGPSSKRMKIEFICDAGPELAAPVVED